MQRFNGSTTSSLSTHVFPSADLENKEFVRLRTSRRLLMPGNTTDATHRTESASIPVEASSTSSREANKSHDHDNNDKIQRLMRSPQTPRVASEVKQDVTASPGSIRISKRASRPQLQSRPTTALSFAGAQGSSSPASRAVSRRPSVAHLGRSANGSDAGDSASPASFVPALDTALDKISILGTEESPAWQSLSAQADIVPFSILDDDLSATGDDIVHEFEDIDPAKADHQDSFRQWKTKLKHFFILSASGKPVYSRHGDDQIIGSYIGVIQTIISSYQNSLGIMKGFKAGDSRFVIVVKGPLTLVAISKLPESERQLQNQLESLYMQILSTLTLPSLEKMFSNRPSTDLRRPLQGTDVLLDGLADGFTRGSPSTLLSALECLRMRKTHRRLINDTLLSVRSPNLMYGLIAAAGRLVSVVRPKKLSLHPGDLHLIFNMLFEAGSIKAGGGENWIPLCLPGFNNRGYVYMYVSFLTADEIVEQTAPESSTTEGELAVILISASKDCFFELQEMRNNLVAQLQKNGSMSIIRTAISKGQATCSDIVPGTVLRHFLYKSRGNVQYVMPSLRPDFDTVVSRRRLMSLYHVLHEAVHLKTSHLKIQYGVSQDASALAWETPVFELYCVAGPRASRALMCQGANKIIQWIRKEEERVFIIGGAVF